MEVGETGIVGAGVPPLVEEVTRHENGCATIQYHLKVVAPAQAMLLRYPDVIYKYVQVSNLIRLWQDHNLQTFCELKKKINGVTLSPQSTK